MTQLLGWTLAMVMGAVGLTAASNNLIGTVFGIIVALLLLWFLKRQRDEGEEL